MVILYIPHVVLMGDIINHSIIIYIIIYNLYKFYFVSNQLVLQLVHQLIYLLVHLLVYLLPFL